ncbi:MAG TPA: hypothetical protein VH539_19190 [Gemmatimonadaceae bacterium]
MSVPTYDAIVVASGISGGRAAKSSPRMASMACQNPSLTYMALTARAADHAVNELSRRSL